MQSENEYIIFMKLGEDLFLLKELLVVTQQEAKLWTPGD